MIKKLIKAVALTLAAATIAACSSADEPATERTTGMEKPREETTTGTRTPEPTRPQRLDHLLPPTAMPEQTAKPATNAKPTETTIKVELERTPAEPSSEKAIAQLVPDNPRTNDQALLQDIYRQIDLEQFALDPDKPIAWPEEERYESRPRFVVSLPPKYRGAYSTLETGYITSTMRYPETHRHPYLHLFPDLKELVDLHIGKEVLEDIQYHPDWNVKANLYPDQQFHHFLLPIQPTDLSAARNGLVYFIYNPWFESIIPSQNDGKWINYGLREGLQSPSYQETDPHWFGNNSTRGVLAETVAEILDEAKPPSAEPHPREWWGKYETFDAIDFNVAEERDWSLAEFISTTTSALPERYYDQHDVIPMEHRATPDVEWEILHPQLPILKITAHASQGLPLLPWEMSEPPKLLERVPSELREEYELVKPRIEAVLEEKTRRPVTEKDMEAYFMEEQHRQAMKEWEEFSTAKTDYSVSFVMSLQNRWTSFDDPNRWIIRFQEDLELYTMPPHRVDTEPPYPNYWDDTDYMQHRIIGPVVLTVHKSPVLRPGTYSRIPRINHWEAPGHILTDRQAKTARIHQIDINRDYWSESEVEQTPRTEHLRVWPDLEKPNAGFPLPGHVLVTPKFGPGTETWRKYNMESWEEYDRSLGAP